MRPATTRRQFLVLGLSAVLLAACGKSASSQPATGGSAPPMVTIFKPPT